MFELMKSYELETYAPQYLTTEFSVVTVLMTMTYSDAMRNEDVQSLHELIYPFLPAGSAPKNFEKLRYMKVRTTANVERVLAMEWVNMSTVKERTSGPVNFLVDDVGPADIGRIQEILAQNNYRVIEATYQQ